MYLKFLPSSGIPVIFKFPKLITPLSMRARILAVDDEPQFEALLRQRFRRQIREGRFEFIFADNGYNALQIVEKDREIDMVLTDINMPKMDGLSFINELKSVRPLLKTVIVSAYGDMNNIRKAMNLGAFDFVTKPIEFVDLETTIDKTLQEMKMLKQAEKARELSETNEKLKELDALKSNFFANISHEFRTPLTVISGMTDQIEKAPDKWVDKGVKMIRRNTDSLLEMVNQILELRKLESGKMSLKLERGEVLHFISYLVESFQSLAESRNIELQLQTDISRLIMDYDPEKLQRILYNLLGNAIKFTPPGGQVFLIVNSDEEHLFLQVKDTGVGMKEEHMSRIFDRYFSLEAVDARKDMGTGIGLSLVKELVKLMAGEIQVDSREGSGTTFLVKLPLRTDGVVDFDPETPQQAASPLRPAVKGLTPTAPMVSSAAGEEADSDLPQLLIVEDNLDVAQYLVACLEDRYQLFLAADGREGINLAIEKVPDIIISDVMMPEKNGYELCDTLKKDERTSHIPIILLTAKADIESKISGLEKGADAYLAKPFNRDELYVRLNKLLELRRKLQEKYSNLEEQPTPVSLEDEFITRVRSEIEQNLDDEFFGIPELCQSIGMSRAQLHRKLKALTGKSTSHYVRSIRLYHARNILLNSDLNIAQVAFEVGFSDPKYFSRVFNEEYGITPKAFREQ